MNEQKLRTCIKLVHRVHVVDVVVRDVDALQMSGQQFFIVQIVDDPIESHKSNVGLRVELFIVLQFGERNISQTRVQLLNRRMQNKVPADHFNWRINQSNTVQFDGIANSYFIMQFSANFTLPFINS